MSYGALLGQTFGGGDGTTNILYGSYTGNQSTSSTTYQTINLGVTPKWVLVFSYDGRTGYLNGGTKIQYGGLFSEGKPLYIDDRNPSTSITGQIATNGFQVRNYVQSSFGMNGVLNDSGVVYYYLAGY